MKSQARILCLTAWALACVEQVTLVYQSPASLVIFGTEMAEANKMVAIHALIFSGAGLSLAVVAFYTKRLGLYVTAISAAMYLVHWFPFKPVFKFGPFVVLKGMLAVATHPSVSWAVIISSFVLPAAFIIVIALAVLERRRRARATPEGIS
jgi:hypothetical protein